MLRSRTRVSQPSKVGGQLLCIKPASPHVDLRPSTNVPAQLVL